MKKTIAVLLVLAVVLGALSLAKNLIANIAVSGGVRAITGLTLQIRSLNVSVLRTLIGIREMKLFNPQGFQDRIMADMPELYVDYDLPSFFRGKVHLEEVRLDLKEFTVVKNEKGELNLDSLKAVQAGKGKRESAQKEAKTEMPKIQIDLLELQVGKVIYKDYSRGSPPKVTEFNVNIRERYQNISNPYALGSLIVSRALFNTTISRLASFDVKALEGQLQELGGSMMKYTTKEVGQKAVGSLKKIFQ